VSRNFSLKLFVLLCLLAFAPVLVACGDQATATPVSIPTAATTPQPSPDPSPSPTGQPASFYSAKTDWYELYAPSEKELNQGREELDYAVEQFRRYFSENPPKIGVVIADTPEQAQPYLDQFKKADRPAFSLSLKGPAAGNKPQGNVMVFGSGGPSGISAGPSGILSREAGAKFFAVYTESKLGKPLSGEDKAKFSPDWFEEAVASLHQPADQQQAPRALLKQALQNNSSAWIPLSELLTMSRPDTVAFSMTVGGPPGGMVQITAEAKLSPAPIAGTPGTGPGSGQVQVKGDLPRDAFFGLEAATLAQFLVEKEGARFIGKIADGLRVGKSFGEILREAKSVPTDLAGLEKAWQDWLKK
jgi:hypothetical protein